MYKQLVPVKLNIIIYISPFVNIYNENNYPLLFNCVSVDLQYVYVAGKWLF